jgi:hypothetical protein
MSPCDARALVSAAGLLAMSLGVVACGPRGIRVAAPADDACRPVTATAVGDAPWDSLPGEWRLTLVATAGRMAGRVAQGNLTLRAQEPSLRAVDRPGPVVVTVPVVGSTDLAVEEAGAIRMGDLRSAEPRQPGVSIWVSRGADGGVSAVLRIGQEEIGTGRQPFDAGYTVLYLRRVTGATMLGGWASGVTDEVASGHFCAVRAGR